MEPETGEGEPVADGRPQCPRGREVGGGVTY